MPSTTCGWCGRFANMTRVEGSENWAVSDEFGTPVLFSLFRCDYCKSASLGYVSGFDVSPAHDGRNPDYAFDKNESNVNWLPSRGMPKPYADVPEHIAAAASEAHSCRSIGAFRAAALLARSVIEATAKNKGITSGKLYDKIEAMESQGLIRPHVKEAAHEVRFFGNDMAHGDFVEPVSEHDADEVLTLMAEVLNEVFQSPARVARIKESREAKRTQSDS